MAKFSVHVWVTPERAVRFTDIEAANAEAAWAAFSIPRYSIMERKGTQFAIARYVGNNNRIYRRKVKLTRL